MEPIRRLGVLILEWASLAVGVAVASAFGFLSYGDRVSTLAVIAVVLDARWSDLAKLPDQDFVVGMRIVADIAMTALLWVAVVVFGLALADVFWQRFDFEKRNMMTRQEVEDERKRGEGDPMVKNRLRQARTVPEASDTGTALTKTLTLSGASLTPGRWNIALSRPVASTLNTTQATVTARVTQRTAPPALTPGQYFNPARDGHGIFIDPAGADWIGVWYSYLEDGSPTWYYLQGAAPGASGIWVATIYRVGWNGSSAHTTVIGDLSVTPTSSTAMVLNYNIDGESGSEPMIQLGGTGCPTSGGAPLRATGHWFSPARSGFGYSAQYEPDQEIYAAYLYDAQGQPRWMLAQAAFNDAQINFPVRQYAGSCPLCGHVPTSSVQTGTLTRTLGTNGDGLRGITNMRLTGTFSGLASGSWTQDFPTTLLSARRTCP